MTVEYWVADPGEALPPADAQWRSFSIGQSLGFQSRPVWLRVDFHQPSLPENPWLMIQPVHLDSIRVISAGNPDVVLFEAGDRVTRRGSIIPYAYTLSVERSMLAGGLLVRVESANVMQPMVSIQSRAGLHNQGVFFYILFSVAFAVTLLYLLWAATAIMTSYSPLIVAFLVRMSLYLVTLIVHMGLTRPLASGEGLLSQDLWHNTMALLYITAAQMFDYMLLRELGARWVSRVFAAFVVIFTLAKAAAWGLADVSLALQLNNASALGALLLALATVPWIRRGNTSIYSITPRAVVTYFLLQAAPLSLVFIGAQYERAAFAQYLSIAFMAAAIVPGGYITYLLFRRQRSLLEERSRLATRAKALQIRSDEERARRKEIGQLLEMLSHEIRTPLATLRMAHRLNELDVEVISRATEAIGHALGQADRVDELERGRLPVRHRRFGLRTLMEEVVDSRRLILKMTGDDLPVIADSDLTRILLTNLLENADKYGTEGAPVQASLCHGSSDDVVLRINNAVVEGGEPDPQQVFTKYYRGETASGQYGTGLGLYIARVLAERMGLSLEMHVTPGQVSVVLGFPDADEATHGVIS
ncbi:ATP-binding protein [Spiribacter sp. 388]